MPQSERSTVRATEVPQEISRHLIGQLPFIATLLAFLMAIVRLGYASQGDSTVLLVLVETLDLQALLLGTLIAQVPIWLVVAAAAFLLWRYGSASEQVRHSGWIGLVTSASIFMGLSCVLLLTLFQVALLVGYASVSVLLQWVFHRRTAPKARPALFSLSDLYPILLVPLLSTVFSASYMWLPSESITLRSTNVPRTVYVLDEVTTWWSCTSESAKSTGSLRKRSRTERFAPVLGGDL